MAVGANRIGWQGRGGWTVHRLLGKSQRLCFAWMTARIRISSVALHLEWDTTCFVMHLYLNIRGSLLLPTPHSSSTLGRAQGVHPGLPRGMQTPRESWFGPWSGWHLGKEDRALLSDHGVKDTKKPICT